MTPAAAAVHAFRFDSPTAHTSLREEVRANETVCGPLESLIKPLTARQVQAVNLLAMGKSVVSVARTLDIGVSTLHRWKATHPLFKVELAQRQHHLFDEMIQKLRLTMSKAVDQLFEMMTGDSKLDRKEVMREMLKLLKPQKFLVPAEPMTAEAVLDETVREGRASRGETVATEISDEERIAAIPGEWRVQGEQADASRHDGPAERSEASGGEVRVTAERAKDPAPRGQILRCAQGDGVHKEDPSC